MSFYPKNVNDGFEEPWVSDLWPPVNLPVKNNFCGEFNMHFRYAVWTGVQSFVADIKIDEMVSPSLWE